YIPLDVMHPVPTRLQRHSTARFEPGMLAIAPLARAAAVTGGRALLLVALLAATAACSLGSVRDARSTAPGGRSADSRAADRGAARADEPAGVPSAPGTGPVPPPLAAPAVPPGTAPQANRAPP